MDECQAVSLATPPLAYTAVMASVIAFMDDLMFLSRVREAARALGLEVRGARTLPQLLEACSPPPRAVLMDLDSPRLPAAEALAALRADPGLAAVPVVGFFSHVHRERARAAHAAGPLAGGQPPAASVSGTLRLAPRLAGLRAASDVLYIVARNHDTNAVVAVRRDENVRFPHAFEISARDVMVEGTPFTGPFDLT